MGRLSKKAFLQCSFVQEIQQPPQCILGEQMSRHKEEGLNAMGWKRRFNSEITSICAYLGHVDKKLLVRRMPWILG